MIACAAYNHRAPFDVHGLLLQCIREADLTEKEIYLGRMDAAEWHRMTHPESARPRPLDLVVLINLLPLKVWMSFGPRLLSRIVKTWMVTTAEESERKVS